MMDDQMSLSHTKWDCKYHVVFIPKYRRKVFYGQISQDLGRVLAALARQKECRIESGSIQPDHVHMLISIPPKHAVSQVVGFIKGVTSSEAADCAHISEDKQSPTSGSYRHGLRLEAGRAVARAAQRR